MAIQYAPLFALETQFQTKDGRNNTGGWLKVFLAATDDPATTYSDYNGTRNPEKIVLDDDGRAVVICDKSKAYRLEVYSIDGTLLWTEEPVYCSGTGGGGVYITKVVSTDGSISIDKNVAGSTTTYDIGLAPNDSDEFLEWIKCSEKDCGATWYPVFQDGSMETEAGKGIKVHGGHLYHFTNSFTVDPDGTGVNYDTFRVSMYCGDVEVDMREFDIDSSLNDPVLCEFSRDVVPSKDTHVYFKLTIPATCKASGEVQCHRIYSGINAVPDTCATKQWVSASYQPLSGMSAYVPYSSIGNNGMGQVTGINGSAIAGGLDSASVSSIASSVASAYTESAFSSLSSKADSSALSAYQPVSAMSAYATTAYVDGMVSGKLDTSAFNSGDFYPTSNPSGFITGVDLGDYATTGFVESAVSGKLDTSAFALASAGFAPAGDYAFNSAVSSKLDASASGNFVMNAAMTSWIPYSALDYSGTAISGIGGSSLAGMGGGGVTGDYVEKSAMEVAIGSGLTALKTAFAQGDNCGASDNSFAQGENNSASANSFAQGYDNRAYSNSFAQGIRNSSTNDSFAQGSSNTASSNSLTQGHHNTATNGSFAQGSWNIASSCSFAQGFKNSANFYSFAQGEYNSADSYSFAQGIKNSASSDSFAQGIRNSAVYTAAVFGSYNLHGNGWTGTGDSAAFAIGDGTADNARHDLMLVTKNGEITMYSSTADTVGLGLVSSIKAISAAATGGVDSATVSAIASAYTTGKQDTLAFAYNTADQISSINGSALAGQVGTTGDYYEKSSTELAYGTAATATRNSFSLGIASADYCSIGINDPTALAGAYNTIATVGSISLGANTARRFSVALGRETSASGYSFAVGDTARAVSNSFAFGWATASRRSFAMGNGVSAINDAMVFGKYNLKGDGNVSTGHSAAFVIGDGTKQSARHDLMLVTRDGEITMFSSTADTIGTGIMSSIRAISAAATGGGVDSATVSAIASSYAESAASGKLDSSAFNSADFYSTSNPSGFITGVDLTPYQPTSAMSAYATTAYVESGLSGKENVFSAGTGLEFVQSGSDRVLQVEAPVDIVAGPGIVIDNPDGNTLRVSLREDYEEVLYAASTDDGTTLSVNDYITLSESLTHFEKVKIYYALQQSWGGAVSHEIYKVSGDQRIVLEHLWFREQSGYNNYWQTITFSKYSDTNLTITLVDGSQRPLLQNSWGSTGLTLTVFKVVGIHRIANN